MKTELLHACFTTIKVYDFDRDGDRVYMTMEYLDGVTLDKVIKAHPNGMEIGLALKIINQLDVLSF